MNLGNTRMPRGTLCYTKDGWIWEGPPIATVSVSDVFLEYESFQWPEVLELGEYRVRLLREQPWDFTYLVVRDRWDAPFLIFANKVARSFELFGISFIRLCEIWGLAHKPEGVSYSWRDIYAVNWLLEKIGFANS